jgi:uncharacterized RDD family membrane protein YckC
VFCNSCGAQNKAEARFCGACGAPLPVPTPADAPPQPMPAPAPEARLASLGDRLIAVILDSILLVAAFALIGMWVATRRGGLTATGFSLVGKPALVAIGATLLAGFLYYWLLEGLLGATLGKAIAGLRVRRKLGGPCGLTPSLVRNLLRIVDGIGVYLLGFLVALFSKSRQRLGDLAAGTIVVERSTGAPLRAACVLVWLALIAGGIGGAYVVYHRAPAAGAGAAVTQTAQAPPSAVAAGELQVVNFQFLEGKGGPPRTAAPYKPGDKVCSRFDVAGYTTDAQGQIDLQVEIAALDPNALSLYRPWQDRMHQTIAQAAPANWTFNFDLPSYGPAGAYRIQIKIRDAVKGAEAAIAPTFTVEAPPVAPASEIEVRGFRFLASEDGPEQDPMIVAPGGTVHMSAQLAGMQFQQDKPDVRVALLVTGPGGKAIVDAPNYLAVNDEQSYHPPTFFARMSGWVRLPPTAAQGSYTVRYTVRDNLAAKAAVHEAKFQVR